MDVTRLISELRKERECIDHIIYFLEQGDLPGTEAAVAEARQVTYINGSRPPS